MAVEKINVTLPTETVLKLRRLIPVRQRSRVIAEATAHYLEALTQKTAFRQVAGLWKDRISLRSQADVNRLLRTLRGSTHRRLTRLSHRG